MLEDLIGKVQRISLKEPAPRKPSINLKEMLKGIKGDALARQMNSLNIKRKSKKSKKRNGFGSKNQMIPKSMIKVIISL